MSKIVYLFAGAGDTHPHGDARTPVEPAPVNEQRMRNILNSPSIQMPNGMTKEQMRAFILAHAGEHAAQA